MLLASEAVVVLPILPHLFLDQEQLCEEGIRPLLTREVVESTSERCAGQVLRGGLQKWSVVQQVPRALWTGRGCHPYSGLALAAHFGLTTKPKLWCQVPYTVQPSSHVSLPKHKAQSREQKAQSTKQKQKQKQKQ